VVLDRLEKAKYIVLKFFTATNAVRPADYMKPNR
jgi:hypothetical protein